MSSRHRDHKVRNLLWLSLIFCIVFLGSIELNLFGFDNLQYNNIKLEENEEKFELIDKLHTSTEFYSGVGKALNTTEYGNGDFPNYNLNLTNNDEASIIIPDGWEANEISGDVFQIYDYDSYFLNDTFDLGYDSNRWTNDSSEKDYVSFGWYNASSGTNDSIYIRFDELGYPWTNDYAYWNHTLTLPREHIDFEYWEISFNYRALYTDPAWLPGASATHNLEVHVDGRSQEFTICKLEESQDLQNNTWHSASFVFQPELYNFNLPGTISLIFIVDYKNSPTHPTGYFEMYYDNVTLKLSTIPKPSQINLTITDITNDDLAIITDTGPYGEGIFDFQNNWKGGSGGLYHNFSFSHNSSGNVILSTDLYSYASAQKKTTTLLGLEGCDYVVENNSIAEWTTYFAVNRPGSYSTDYYFNITKPLNWVITAVIDPYLNNKIGDVLGTGYGDTTISIPNNIITNGAWKFVAEAPNYLIEASVFQKNDQEWMKNSTFYPLEMLKINATASTDLIANPELTNACLTIFFPNGTTFHKENASLSSDGTVEFSEINLGQKNTTVGTYSVCIQWSESIVNMSQVGFYQLNFRVFHHTSLTPVKDYYEQIAGEPLLIKVQFTDDDLNRSIDNAEIAYKSSFGSSGSMVYIGSGIYSSEIDTNGLPTGDYYFSVNASKPYYENHTTTDLIHLKLTAQPLKLVFPSRLLNSTGNEHVIFEFNLEGEISGAPILGANISTNWINDAFDSVDDYGNGTYALNFSTQDLPLEGVIEAFEIEIFANKTNFRSVSDYVTILIHPVATLAHANQTNVFSYINENFEVKVNYTEENGELINEAECTVSWPSSYEITPVSDGFIIRYSTINLEIDVYNSLVKLSKPGYEDALVSITILINEHEINMLVEVNGDLITQNSLIELFFKENVNLTARVFTEPEGEYLTGGTFTILSDNYQNILAETPTTFFSLIFNINGENFSSGLNSIFLRYEKQNYTTKIFSFQFFIRAQNVILEVKIDNQNILENYLIERYDHENITVSCQALAEVEEIYLTGASVKLIIGVYEIDFLENPNYWYNKTFSISLDIFSLGINSVYLKFELANYTTTTFSFQFLVRAQEILLEVKIDNQDILEDNLIERYEYENITISCQAFAEVEDIYLTGASVKLIIGGYEIDFLENPNYWYNKTFSISHDIFSLGINSVYLRFELTNYTTTTFSFQFYVVAQNVILEVKLNEENLQENNLIEISYNNFTSLSCRALASMEDIYLTGASVKLIIDTHEIDLLEYPNYWYNKTFTISTDIFSLGINYVYLKFELANYTTTTFSFQIQVKQIELIVKTINFIDSLSRYVGDSVLIQINLTEHGSNELIENATIYCYWRYGTYYFSEMGDGLYKLELDLSQTEPGTHRFYLVITTEETVYKTTEFSFLIIISERELPNFLLNVIIISLIAVAGVLGILSVRSYVLLPRKRRRDLIITEKTQPYKDIRNVEAFICSSKSSGLSLYNKTFSIINEEYITGFSGFIQAITILEKQYTKSEVKIDDVESTSEEFEGDSPEIKELDFNFFNSLICDYKNLRIILVLRELSSKRLREKIKALAIEIYSQCEDTITQFKGNLSGISEKVEGILSKYLPLFYKEEFVLNKGTQYHSAKISGDLSKLEIRILNILEAQSKFKPQFLLDNTLSMVENVSEDKKIIAIESLIKQGLIKPAK